MTLEESITSAVQAAIAPLAEAQRKLIAQVESLRRALPAQLATVQEAAKTLGVSTKTVRRWAKDGTLPTRRVGKSLRIDMTQVSHGPGYIHVAQVVSDFRSQ